MTSYRWVCYCKYSSVLYHFELLTFKISWSWSVGPTLLIVPIYARSLRHSNLETGGYLSAADGNGVGLGLYFLHFYIGSPGLCAFTVVQRHRNLLQSKAHVRLSMGRHCSYASLLSLTRYNDVLVENRVVRRLTARSLVRRPFRGFPSDQRYENWYHKTKSPSLSYRWWNCLIEPINTCVHRVLTCDRRDRRTDERRHMCTCRDLAAELDVKLNSYNSVITTCSPGRFIRHKR